jgi:hypothetical protein
MVPRSYGAWDLWLLVGWVGYAVCCGPALRRVCLAWLCYPSGERVCARLPIRARWRPPPPAGIRRSLAGA